MDCRMTVTTSEKSIHAMQKGGGNGAFSPKEVSEMVDKALSKHKDIKKKLK
jgi:exosome complex RNA-binding protein Rrp42 (RNase PH superfamily)